MNVCLCPDGIDCWYYGPNYDGYPWCRPCGEHHRAPECAIDQQGRALSSCGCPWERIEADTFDHLPGCCYAEDDTRHGAIGT